MAINPTTFFFFFVAAQNISVNAQQNLSYACKIWLPKFVQEILINARMISGSAQKIVVG
jgi:hypothetical protein